MTTRMASPVRVSGPLAVHADAFREGLVALGYTPLSAANQLRLMAHVSRWLAGHGLGVEQLTEERVGQFLADRRAEGYTCWLSPRGMGPLVEFLAGQGAVPAGPPAVPASSPRAVLVEDYRAYLVSERALSASTVRQRLEVARMFLDTGGSGRGGLALGELSAAEVVEFVSARCRDRSVGWAKNLVTNLRSLLRFLHLRGHVASPLSAAVPAVAGWRGGSLPRALPAADVRRLLASCDRRRATGRRDFAILVLLARLGLRAAEVAALELDDIDWRAGEVVIRGKGRREERLPLPVDVGEAMVGYLRRGRPGSDGRQVFMRAQAPHGPLSAAAVKAVVGTACDRAGLARIGAHCLRHSVATEMLRAGGSLAEVGQVLRHRSPSTTAIYAKVDRVALRRLALPWPGGAA